MIGTPSALCPWCDSWERIATSGEVGSDLDVRSPGYAAPTCGHPTGFWPLGKGTPPEGSIPQPWPDNTKTGENV